jgi:pectate lyase
MGRVGFRLAAALLCALGACSDDDAGMPGGSAGSRGRRGDRDADAASHPGGRGQDDDPSRASDAMAPGGRDRDGGGSGASGAGGRRGSGEGPRDDDGGSSPGAGDGTLQGFGASTPGGAGGRTIRITEATDRAVRDAFEEAQAGDVIVVFEVDAPIEIASPLPQLIGAFVTIDGNCATLVGTGLGATQAMVDVRGHDVIVRNLRLRDAGDNLRAQGPGAYNIVFDHISSTGATDDGLSIGYGAHDVTVQYSFLSGNTRSIFIKYDGATNVSIHHTWITKQWIRGPLVNGAMVDLRNLIVEDWTEWGTRFEEGATGNAVNSLWVLSEHARSVGGKVAATLYGYNPAPGPVWVEGNAYRDQAQEAWSGTAAEPLPAPEVTTHSVVEMEPIVRAQAGCLPRDSVDQAYIDLRDGWDIADSRPLRIQ